jgi:hexosaminidase
MSIADSGSSNVGEVKKINNVLQPTEATFRFLEDVLTEVMDLVPHSFLCTV